MARKTIDRNTKKAIIAAQRMIEEVQQADGNEAETRRRVERIFDTLMGYDPFKHLSREHAVRGAGETEHVDFAIHVDGSTESSPNIMVELKRVGVDLAPKHLKQVSSYAINAGCEWILLTNGREWRIYHVSFGQPPETKLLKSWDLLLDDAAVLAQSFELISFKSVRKGALDKLWQKSNVLTARNVLAAILSEGSIAVLRRELKRSSDVAIAPEDVVSGVRRLLNEAALTELSSIRISLPERKRRRRKSKPEQTDEPKVTNDKASASADARDHEVMRPAE